jgi:hypothetical protein
MTTIENAVETGTTVMVDDKFFTHCRYTRCTLIYLGGEFGWFDTQFTDCKIILEGAAKRTAEFMKTLGIQPINTSAGVPGPTPKSPEQVGDS